MSRSLSNRAGTRSDSQCAPTPSERESPRVVRSDERVVAEDDEVKAPIGKVVVAVLRSCLATYAPLEEAAELAAVGD